MKRPIEIVRKLDSIKSVQDVCGEIKALSTERDLAKANLAMAIIKSPTIPHYHKRITEFYYIINGLGKLIVGKNTHNIKSRTLTIIPPFLAHYTIPRSKKVKVLTFAVPAWTEKDQFILKEDDFIADYSPYKEKFELIYEILSRADMDFEPGMSRKEREVLDIERQIFVMRAGYNKMSILVLRELFSGR